MFQVISWWLLKTVAKLILVVAGLWLYKELTMGICRCRRRLDGRIALVTGGTSGVGYATALGLAKRGARIILTSRDENRGARAAEAIMEAVPEAEVESLCLDLSDSKSIQTFCDELSDRVPSLHILVNNAGVFQFEDG